MLLHKRVYGAAAAPAPYWCGVASGVINSDFLERAQWRGEAAKEAQEQIGKLLEKSSFAQTPQQAIVTQFSKMLPNATLISGSHLMSASWSGSSLGF